MAATFPFELTAPEPSAFRPNGPTAICHEHSSSTRPGILTERFPPRVKLPAAIKLFTADRDCLSVLGPGTVQADSHSRQSKSRSP
jgi:hypothetical protein